MPHRKPHKVKVNVDYKTGYWCTDRINKQPPKPTKPHTRSLVSRRWSQLWASLWNNIHSINGGAFMMWILGIVLAACLITYFMQATAPKETG